MSSTPIGKNEVLEAARTSVEALRQGTDQDWNQKAGDLDLSCRDTLNHVITATLNYASNLATRSTQAAPRLFTPNPEMPIEDLIIAVGSSAAILAEVIEAAPEGARGFHPRGQADASGFAGMYCNEVLIHTADVAAGLGFAFLPPDDLSSAVVARLFPWAPSGAAGWDTHLWCAGRAALPDRPRLEANWTVHCAPLSEWDGTMHTREIAPR